MPSYGPSSHTPNRPASVNTSKPARSNPNTFEAPIRIDYQGDLNPVASSKPFHNPDMINNAHYPTASSRAHEVRPYKRQSAAFAYPKDYILLHAPKVRKGGAMDLPYDDHKHNDIFIKTLSSEPYFFSIDSLRNFKTRNKPCDLPQLDGQPVVCGTYADSQHLLSHLPKGIGYFWICPACGHGYKLVGFLKNHCRDHCEHRNVVTWERLLKDAKKNRFLR